MSILVAAMIESVATYAMTPDQYDRMSARDRANYMTALASGTMHLLQAEGRNDDANKIFAIFSTDKYDRFTNNLAAAEKLNVNRSEDKKLQVEHVFLLTLKQNGIVDVPQAVMTINKDFKPQYAQDSTNKREAPPLSAPR